MLLNWAGLKNYPAGPIAEVANRNHIARTTLTNRIRQVTHPGADTPLGPLLLRDATRVTESTEDHLSRRRTAQLSDRPPPRSQWTQSQIRLSWWRPDKPPPTGSKRRPR